MDVLFSITLAGLVKRELMAILEEIQATETPKDIPFPYKTFEQMIALIKSKEADASKNLMSILKLILVQFFPHPKL